MAGTKSKVNKPRSSFWPHALIWIVAIAGGTAFAKFVYPDLVKPGRISIAEREQEYRVAWKQALLKIRDNPPPPIEEVIDKAPLGQRNTLQVNLARIYTDNLPHYLEKANENYSLIEKEFRNDWERCADEFVDTPTVEQYLQRVNEFHHETLKKRLAAEDARLTKKNPRTRIAMDAFSGYCVFRSKEFHDRATTRDLRLHFVDDGANYEKRINALKSGEVKMAAFTLDALINNSAKLDLPPSVVVMIIDETRGADAMVAYKEGVPKIAAMNKPGMEVFVTRDSPSELLARLVGDRHKMPKLMNDALTKTDDVEEVFKQFAQADPSDPKAFVLWEPFVSKALQNPKSPAHVLATSNDFRGYIVDVLVARKEFVATDKEEVAAIVRTYLETAAEFQRSESEMVRLVREDSVRLALAKKLPTALTDEEAAQVVRGISWKSTTDNYGHFGLLTGDEAKSYQPIEKTIKDIANVLTVAKVIARKVDPGSLVNKEILANLKQDKAPAGDVWSRLKVVENEKVEPISFSGDDTIRPLYFPNLTDLADKLKAEPHYYLEIRSVLPGTTDEDKDLALRRGEAVAKWLREQGGIVATRMKMVTVNPAQGIKAGSVTFVVLEDRK